MKEFMIIQWTGKIGMERVEDTRSCPDFDISKEEGTSLTLFIETYFIYIYKKV